MSFKKMFWVVFFVLLLQPQLYSFADSSIEQKIKAEISNRHPDHPDEFWQSLGVQAVPVIVRMYGEVRSSYQRSRLIEGLGAIGGDEALSALAGIESSLQSGRKNRTLMRKVAVSSIQAGQGELDPSGFSKYLNSTDSKLRQEAWKHLQSQYADHPVYSEWLKKSASDAAKSEKEGWVLKEIKEVQKKQNEQDKSRQGAWSGYWHSGAGLPVAGNIQVQFDGDRLIAKTSSKDGAVTELKDLQFRVGTGVEWLQVYDRKQDKIFIAQRILKKDKISIKPISHGN